MKKVAPTSNYFYDWKYGNGGGPMDSMQNPGCWRYVEPDTNGENLLKIACGKKQAQQ